MRVDGARPYGVGGRRRCRAGSMPRNVRHSEGIGMPGCSRPSALLNRGVAVAENARVAVETVVVGRGGDRELSADLYRPPEPNGAGVLLVHGGGFVQGGRGQLKGYGIGLGRPGYTCLACEYRLAPEAKWPAQIDDVHTA